MAFLKSDFLKNSSVLFSSTGIAQLISFLIIPILARMYSPAEHGIVTLFTSIVSVCVAFSCMRYDQAIVVEEDHNKAKHLVYLSVLLSLAWCILFYLILLLFQPYVYQFFNIQGGGKWIYLVPITMVFSSLVEVMVMWYNRQRKYHKLAVNRVVGMASGSAYKLGHPYLNLLSGNGLVFGHVFGQAIQMLMLTPISKLRNISVDWAQLKMVAKRYRSFPMLATPSALVNIVGSFIPVFLISMLIGEEMTGFYGNAIKLAFVPLSAVSYAVGQVFFERLARLSESEDERLKLSNDLLKFLFFLAVVPVSVLMVWGDELVPWILGSDWEVSGTIAQVTAVFFFAMYLTGPFSAAFEVFNRLGRQLWFTGTFTIFTALGLYIGYQVTENIFIALMIYAFIGIVIRLAMLYDCFRLMGGAVYGQMIKGILMVAGLTLLMLSIKLGLQ